MNDVSVHSYSRRLLRGEQRTDVFIVIIGVAAESYEMYTVFGGFFPEDGRCEKTYLVPSLVERLGHEKHGGNMTQKWCRSYEDPTHRDFSVHLPI
jgi:hypothetical protein